MSLEKPNENDYYNALASHLKNGSFTQFKELIDQSIHYLDPKLIPDRFNIISYLLYNTLNKVISGDSSYLGEVIDILRFCSQFNLIERELKDKEMDEISKIKSDKIFLANLNDLFGKISNSFIYYIRNDVPRVIFDFIKRSSLFFGNIDNFANYVKNVHFNQYVIYGLSVKYITFFEEFLLDIKNNSSYNPSLEFFEFFVNYEYIYIYSDENGNYKEVKRRKLKKHLTSPRSLLLNIDDMVLKNQYKFFNLSMVLLGGIGPQGHGFTYLTPKGEVIEICSDIKENDAIIVKYKQFLKQQFLRRLSEELKSFDNHLKNKLLNYLDSIFENQELIGYNKKSIVMSKIKNYLSNFEEKLDDYILEKISNAITIILRPITMVDQFKCRIDLIRQGKLKSEDIAKLTSLEDKRDKSKSKTHYDVLRERLFFQYVNDWFYELYMKKKKN